MSRLLDPLQLRDFSRGRIAKSAVASSVLPLNSVSNSINVDFSEVIGGGIVRKGNRSLDTLVTGLDAGSANTSSSTTAIVMSTTWQAQNFVVPAGTGILKIVSIFAGKQGTGTSGFGMFIYNTSAGLPTTVVSVMNPTYQDTEVLDAGQTLFFNGSVTLTPGSTYAIVMTGGIASREFLWYKRTSGGSFASSVSTNSGSSWTAHTSGHTFRFATFFQSSAAYNTAPLGSFSGLISTTPVNATAYSYLPGFASIFYYDGTDWEVSNLNNLNSTAKVRFALLNGTLFLANANTMQYSTDNGLTWQAGTSNNLTITQDAVAPNLLWVSKNRLIASGSSNFKSRVYFSTIIDPDSANFITWNTNPTNGDWIDINPDDGGVVTGFADASNLQLIFKTNAMYRLNTINKTVDSENIFNVGAVSQESITKCLGFVYFYSGNGIYRTDSSFPEMISRIAVQDFVDAITSPSEVYAGTDGLNVYFSIGLVVVNGKTYTNTVLKFSPRDENWQIYTYSKRPAFFSLLGAFPNQKFISAQYNGDMGQLEYSTNNADYGNAIPYSLETQELDITNRANTKVISDKVVIFTRNGSEGNVQIKANGEDYESLNADLNNEVCIVKNVEVEGNYFIFRWMGEAKFARPVLDGFYLPVITDQGIIK